MTSGIARICLCKQSQVRLSPGITDPSINIKVGFFMSLIKEKKAGSALRDKVASILALSHRTLEIEHPLVCTTADIFFIDERTPKFKMKIAIECKDWDASLSSANLAEIETLYRPSINSGEIDFLWIISTHELGQSPSRTVNGLKNVEYSTYQDFLSTVMNFGLLLEDNIAAFSNHDSSRNFLTLHAKSETGQISLEEYTRTWVKSDTRTLIVYGGYGLGKTSFSLYLASILSKEYQNGLFDRIPIRIALGGLYTKQDLRGLICSLLTGSEGGPSVGNFSYNLFLRMVHEGLFLIILDGFDEMRHAMSAEEFAFTFEQMSPLFGGQSKTILLGRPDSFFSDEEEDQILSDLLAEIDSDWDEFARVEVSSLSPEQIDQYVANFTSRTPKASSARSGVGPTLSGYDSEELDILSRPVQLSMYTKIVKRNARFEGRLTRYALYSEFVFEFVKREQSKEARRVDVGENALGYSDPRSVFMQNVAWWVLVEKRENRFTANELPRELIPYQLVKEGKSAGSLREAIVGSVIERISHSTEAVGSKGGTVFYFPHKSYLEFLVAGYFVREIFSREMFAKFFRFANKEILSFITEGPPEGIKNVKLGLEYVRGQTLRDFFRAAARHPDYDTEEGVSPSPSRSAPEIFTIYERRLAAGQEPKSINEFILDSFKTATTLTKFYAALQVGCEQLNRLDCGELLEKLVCFILNSLDERHLLEFYNANPTHLYHVIGDDIRSIRSVFLSRCVVIKEDSIHVSLRKVSTLLNDIARTTFQVSDFELNQDGVVDYTFNISTSEQLGAFSKELLKGRTIPRVPIKISGPLERVFDR